VTSISFDVPINDDNIFEGNETLQLVITTSSLPSRVSQAVPNQTSITIFDNDGKYSVCFSQQVAFLTDTVVNT